MTSNDSTMDDFLAGYFENPTQMFTCNNESDWYHYWESEGLNRLTPPLIALKGGIQAPNLAYVFIAGYQAAMRHVFPEIPKDGWTAFAASEDIHNPTDNPPLLITKNGDTISLNGTKSWVAQSKSVDYLIVTAKNDNKERAMVLVEIDQQGLLMSHRKSPSFLADMSQGFARFSEAIVDANALIEGERLKTFMKSESKFIMLALCGWFYKQSLKNQPALAADFRLLAADYFSVSQDNTTKVTALADLDTRLQSLFKTFNSESDTSTISNWQSDCALVSMYSKGLQSRAAKRVNN